jgi:hypothetical protein
MQSNLITEACSSPNWRRGRPIGLQLSFSELMALTGKPPSTFYRRQPNPLKNNNILGSSGFFGSPISALWLCDKPLWPGGIL